MSWIRIDDHAPEHQKMLDAGADGCWLWVCGLAYANRQPAHDGFIPERAVLVLYPLENAREVAKRLVDVGLWDPVPGGYQIHDYHKYQPTKEQVDKRKADRVAAGRLGGTRSAESKRSKQEAERKQTASESSAIEQQAGEQTPSNGEPNEPANFNPDPDPLSHSLSSSSQPDPTCQVEVAAPMPRESVVTLTTPITPECTEIAKICGVQDVVTAWRKFTGVFNGRSIELSGKWQWFCAKEAKDERAQRDRERSRAATRTEAPAREAIPAKPATDAITDPKLVDENLRKLRETLTGAGVPPWEAP